MKSLVVFALALCGSFVGCSKQSVSVYFLDAKMPGSGAENFVASASIEATKPN